MQIIFLGTNGWYNSDVGQTICILIKTDQFNLILDAGTGLHYCKSYLNYDVPTYLFISHFHFDHICGLHFLPNMGLVKPLIVLQEEFIAEQLNLIVNAPFMCPFNEMPFDVHMEGKENKPFDYQVFSLQHSTDTLGISLYFEGKKITYIPDTGYCEDAIKFAKDSNVTITECSYLPGEEDKNWPHLNPESAARIAKLSGSEELILTHFDASRYKSLDDRERAGSKAKEIFLNTIVSHDKMIINI